MPTPSMSTAVPNPWLVALTVGMAAFMEVLDISIANVALQHIAGSLSASQDEATWVLTSYLVTNAVILLMSGWLSNVIGRKRYFIGCIIGFSITSFFCGLAPSLGFLILFRGLQGLIGGGLQPCAQAILADAFPPQKRNMAFAIYGLSVVFAPAIGPTLGGWITDNFSWRWVFFINVPVGALLTFIAMRMVHDSPEQIALRQQKMASGFEIDYIGFILLCLGMGGLQIVLDRGQIDDWFDSSFISWLSLMAGGGLITFVWWELRSRHPIVELSLLKNPNFAIGNFLMFFLGFVLLASTVLLPEFAQEILGYTATDAGLVISPGGFALLLLMPLVGFLSSKIDPRFMIACGLIICACSLLRMTELDQHTDYATLAWTRLYQATGLALLFIPINGLAYQGLAPSKSSNASAIINMMRNVGGSMGISVVTTILSRRSQIHQNILVQNITSTNPQYRDRIHEIQQSFHYFSDKVAALHQAQGLFYREILQQAQLLAYIDDFRFLAILFFLLVPILAFLKKPKTFAAKIPSH